MSNSDRAWQKWGDADPYYAVLTDNKFRSATIDENRFEFFQQGTHEIQARLEKAERHFGRVARNRALYFGCGVGRLTLALAKEFDAVVGLDISDAMLAEAKRNAAAENVGNASFFSSDDALSAATGTYDFVGTYIVIQHIPIIRGIPIIANLLDRVAPDGIASIHFSIARNESTIGTAKYWIHRHAPLLRQMSSIVRHRRQAEPLMQMNQYPLAEILAMFKDRGFGDVLIETEMHGSILTANLISRRTPP